MGALLIVYVGLAALGPLAGWLERPAGPPARSVRLDALYWLVTPIFTGVLTRGLVVALAIAGLLLTGATPSIPDALEQLSARDPIGLRRLPAPALGLAAFLLLDVLSYASHRLRHAIPALRALHAVHHAPADLDWRAAARMHPLDDLVDNGCVFFPLIALGVPPALVLLAGPLLLLHTIHLHARMAVPLGPLDRVIASPGFHRAHHAVEGRLGNFGGVLSVWDHLLGTARAPDLDVPTGLPSTAALPETLLGQLVVPILRALRR